MACVGSLRTRPPFCSILSVNIWLSVPNPTDRIDLFSPALRFPPLRVIPLTFNFSVTPFAYGGAERFVITTSHL